jgi:hypothetical protein
MLGTFGKPCSTGGGMKNTVKNRLLINKVLDLAKRHLSKSGMKDSARLCYKTACEIMDLSGQNTSADITGADYYALRSLSYSVGMFHADYKVAQNILSAAG